MLRIGIIGSNFGVVGLIPSFAFQKKCKVIAVCAKKSENLDNVLKKLGPINIYTDWKLLLKKEKLDAIAIAVVPKAQYQITKVAILKGINVFAEKPLAVNLSEARELLSLAKKMKSGGKLYGQNVSQKMVAVVKKAIKSDNLFNLFDFMEHDRLGLKNHIQWKKGNTSW